MPDYSRVPSEARPDASRDAEEQDHLVDAFGTDSEDGSDLEDWEDDRGIQGSRQGIHNPFTRTGTRYAPIEVASSNDVLFDAEAPAASTAASGSSSPPSSSTTNVAETNRAGAGAPPNGANFSSTFQQQQHRFRPFRSLFSWNRGRQGSAVGNNNNNDGVFANITAKPDSEKPEDGNEDEPPSYDEAAADATPPYWETTILAPGYSDELFIEGLPVGTPINFIWNMIVSSAFQFVGFFLTYLLHTSHAAKQGSRAGLGFTLIQCGYYLTPETEGDSTPAHTPAPPSEFKPNNPNDYDISPVGAVSGTFSQGHASATPDAIPQSNDMDTASWISTGLIVVGTIIILKSVFDYIQARRMEAAILSSNNATQEETPQTAEEMV
ncbi:metal homeostatis protein Bsd2p [Trichomonascus vanleenenianus]|uniref:Bsd2p n=1 Tax=Trichomonascus vanleenenianus TaxID=2268995 RepID=UPI003ECADABD